MAKILIKNGRVWDGERFLYSDVLTDGEYVTRIGKNIECDGAIVFDASGMMVSAGLVDVHTHLRVLPTDRYGMQAEMCAFPFGVTAAADAGRADGEPSVYDAFMLKSLVFVSVQIKDNTPDLISAEIAIEKYKKRVCGLKVYFDVASSEVRDVTPLVEICEMAHSRGLRVMVHCTGSPIPMSDILETLGEGDILTHAFHGGVNNASDDGYESMRMAQRRGVVIDTGFAGYVHTDFAVFDGAIKSGIVPDTISTDITKLSAYVRGGRYGMTLAMSLARGAGMSEDCIFRCVTHNAAAALGKDVEWGTLREGGRADIAVLSYTDEGYDMTDAAGNRVKSDVGYRCMLTIADGQIVYKY